jgi:uncharacterized membrane protein YjjP (DUF1212 family)
MASAVTYLLAWNHASITPPEPVSWLLVGGWLAALLSLILGTILFLVEEPKGRSFSILLTVLIMAVILIVISGAYLALLSLRASVGWS